MVDRVDDRLVFHGGILHGQDVVDEHLEGYLWPPLVFLPEYRLDDAGGIGRVDVHILILDFTGLVVDDPYLAREDAVHPVDKALELETVYPG